MSFVRLVVLLSLLTGFAARRLRDYSDEQLSVMINPERRSRSSSAEFDGLVAVEMSIDGREADVYPVQLSADPLKSLAVQLGGGGSGGFVGALGAYCYKEFNLKKDKLVGEVLNGYIVPNEEPSSMTKVTHLRRSLAQELKFIRVEFGHCPGKRQQEIDTLQTIMATPGIKIHQIVDQIRQIPCPTLGVYMASPLAVSGTVGSFLVSELNTDEKKRVAGALIQSLAATVFQVLTARFNEASVVNDHMKAFRATIWDQFLARTDRKKLRAILTAISDQLSKHGRKLHSELALSLIGKLEAARTALSTAVEKYPAAFLPAMKAEGVHSDMTLGNILVEQVPGDSGSTGHLAFNDNAANPKDKLGLESEVSKVYFGFLHQGELSDKYKMLAVNANGDQLEKLEPDGASHALINRLQSFEHYFDKYLARNVASLPTSHDNTTDADQPAQGDIKAVMQRGKLYAIIQHISDSGYVLLDSDGGTPSQAYQAMQHLEECECPNDEACPCAQKHLAKFEELVERCEFNNAFFCSGAATASELELSRENACAFAHLGDTLWIP